MAPTDVSVEGCTIYWSYPDPDDVDGYAIYIVSGKAITTTSTSYTITNPTDEPLIEINSTWHVSIRAYQHLIGPATDEVMVVTIGE